MGQIFAIPILIISWPVIRGAIAKPDWAIKKATADEEVEDEASDEETGK